ncbi:unnamed protein product (macronuclear) [Paramecium tetraurelia]|uniref:LisH domain-containing protein n=1 Tax=Paramecium tetraurelia TaxID=5888 RepID=A0BZI6_PARTE|nr:uncharacterized protein GSPATT00033806001 [Paramecium tetraurelia]CAK63953.1 unnamed protein product [Paramecium tetraurelia]|eukprot:XP_001431351.1 hypothetical protein (macronuclear) [Paramecium tetraurelia strain d4-2]
MNEICLPQNHHIIQILYEYLQKHGMNLDNPPTTKLFELFIQTHEITYQKKEFQLAQLNSKIFQITQELNTLQNNIEGQYSVIKNIKNRRVKLHIELDLQESHLHKIEKSISEIHNDPSIIQKISDLTEGIKICRDRYLSIKEENEQFNKIQTTLTQQKQQLKNRYKFAQDKIKNNLIQIDDLKEQSVSLNNRLIKQLKTVTELFQLNHKRTINQKHTNYVNNPIHNDDTSMILINLIEFLINLQMQILNKSGSNISSEDEILDLIQTILNLKSQLNQMKIQDNSEEQSKLTQQTESISIRQRFRYKTHHNLGEIKLSKHSQQGQDSKGTSQYDDEIMENQSSDNDCLQELIQISPKKPWQFKSVIIDSSKNSEKKMEYLSEQQIKSQNLKSLASISSDASFQDLRVTTLQEELQTVYSYDQTQGENIQVTSCCYDTQERTQINSKMESNLYDPDQTKCIQDQKNRRNFKITGFIMMTIGIAGWMYQRSK